MFAKHLLRDRFMVLLSATFLSVALHGFAEDNVTMFTGTSLGVTVIAPVREEMTYSVFTVGDLAIGTRGLLGSEGYYSFASKLKGTFRNDLIFYDEEYTSLKLGIGNTSFETAFLSSLIDDGSGSPYLNPSWNISTEVLALPNNAAMYVSYAGYLASTHEDDYLYEGVKAMFRADPSVTLGYEIGLGGGWEYFYEQAAYDQSGDSMGRARHDLVLEILGTVDGFAGYFTEWAVSGGTTYRTSNVSLLESSEDRLTATVDAALFTSPHQSWTIDGTLALEGTRYFFRPARKSDGLLGDDRLLLFDVNAFGKAEWSPDQTLYLALSAAFGYTLSNDPFFGGWYAKGVFTLTL